MPDRKSVLVLDADDATRLLIDEWLDAEGWHSLDAAAPEGVADPSLIVLDLPYPRDSDKARLAELRERYPGVPVLVVSPTFFATVGCCGPCAASLGVAGVLPKPLDRDALLAAARRLAT